MEDLIQKISFFAPEDYETIVLTFKNNTDLAELTAMMPYLQKHFPKNKIIAIPYNLELSCMDTDALIHYLQEGDKDSIVKE